MARLGWFKFYPGDWNGDTELASCSLAAQGLLARLLNVLYRANPGGFLLINGQKPNENDIAKALCVTKTEYKKYLKELLDKGVLKEDATGIYSARVIRELEQSEEMSRRGALGGNPALVNQELNQKDKHTRLNLTEQNRTDKNPPTPLEGADGGFGAFWEAYPRKVEKQKALRVWKARLREGVDPGALVSASRNYAKAVAEKGTDARFVKHPATFLGPDKPYEEWALRVVCENEGVPVLDLLERDVERCGCPKCAERFKGKEAALAREREKREAEEEEEREYREAFRAWEASGFEGPGPEHKGVG